MLLVFVRLPTIGKWLQDGILSWVSYPDIKCNLFCTEDRGWQRMVIKYRIQKAEDNLIKTLTCQAVDHFLVHAGMKDGNSQSRWNHIRKFLLSFGVRVPAGLSQQRSRKGWYYTVTVYLTNACTWRVRETEWTPLCRTETLFLWEWLHYLEQGKSLGIYISPRQVSNKLILPLHIFPHIQKHYKHW